MSSVVSSLTLLLALAGPTARLDDLVDRARELHEEYGDADSNQERNKLWAEIRKTFDELEKLREKRAAKAIAKFYDYSQLDSLTTAALADMDTKASRKAIAATLLEDDRSSGRSGRFSRCRRANILRYCHSLSGSGIPMVVLEEVLEDEEHARGVQSVLKVIASRLSAKRVESLMKILDKTTGMAGLGALETRDREEAVFTCLIDGLSHRGHPPIGQVDSNDPDEETLAGSVPATKKPKKLKQSSLDDIFDTLTEYAGAKKKSHMARAVSMRVLGAYKHKGLVGPLKRVFETESEHRSLVLAATKAAISLEATELGPVLLPIIEKTVKKLRKDPSRIEEAVDLVQAIYPLRIKDASKLVVKLSRSKNRFLRMAAVAALPALGEEEAKPLLARHLADKKDWRMQLGAIEACRKMKTRTAVDLLIKRMSKQRGRLQYDLLAALHDLTGVGMPYVAKDWEQWWVANREHYKPPDRQKPSSEKKTKVLFPDAAKASYFGIKVLSNRLCFIADTSGSMSANMTYRDQSSRRIEALKSELRRLVKTFDKRTYFNLYFFESEYSKRFKRLTPRTKKSKKTTKQFLDGVRARGGTNLYDPLADALKDPNVDTIYLLSDGEPSEGKYTKFKEILRNVRRINRLRKIQINTIAIGTDSKLMRLLAKQNSGLYRSLK